MKFRFLLPLAWVFMFSFSAHAYDLPSSLGHLTKWKKTAHEIHLTATNGHLRITVFSANVIRIEVSEVAHWSDASYATVAKPQTAIRWNLEVTSTILKLTTDSLVLHIHRRPVRLTWYNARQQLLSAEDQALGTEWLGRRITVYRQLLPGEKFIGLGEKTGPLNRRGHAYVHWNTDMPAYSERQDPLYASIPFFLGIHDSLCYGIFLDNSSRTEFNFGASQNRYSSFSVAEGPLRYYFISHTTVAQILNSYSWLTGTMPLPPRWALGYHQSRWSYYPESQVLQLAHTFRSRRLPCDALWLDIHYMDDYKVFTWHPQRFPNPQRLLDSLDKLGFQSVIIIDPGIKAEKGYPVYDQGMEQKCFLTYPDGAPYFGEVWPGWCAFTDYSNPWARQWWGSLFSRHLAEGVDGFWCDMNEIATWGQDVPLHLRFHGDGQPFSYATGKNLYGLLMCRATFEGVRRLQPHRRPFLLTRAAFAGIQRYSAIWTGDNVSSEAHMLLGVRLLNSLGLSGVPFCGVDIGGFIGTATPELFARWMSIGVFSPFLRGHKEINGPAAEPWAFNEQTERICRSYLNMRYRLLPYIYSTFYEASSSGLPVQRSLAIEFTHDPNVYLPLAEHNYMFGNALLVVPATPSQQFVHTYLPHGYWFNLHSGVQYHGRQTIIVHNPLTQLPVFARAGSVLFMQSLVQYTRQHPSDTLFVHAFYGHSVRPQTFYEDSGDGYAYLQDHYHQRKVWLDTVNQVLEFSAAQGTFPSAYKIMKVYLHGFPQRHRFFVNGQPTETRDEWVSFWGDLPDVSPLRTLACTLPYHEGPLRISWNQE